mgnify:CR=1 FL=1
MTTVQDLQKQFHCCMPLFIALGDKVRLSIVELLTEAAVRSEDPQGTIDFEGHAMNVNEPFPTCHIPSSENFKRCGSGRCTSGRDSQLLLSHLT